MTRDKVQFLNKYSPRSANEFIGNPAAIKGLFNYVKQFRNDPNDVEYRGIAIVGPIGVGKTRLAEYLAESRGMVPIVITTTDARRHQEVENVEIIYRTNMAHLYKIDHPIIKNLQKNGGAQYIKDKPMGKIIIIDEVESITKGDKGLLVPLTKLLKDGPTSPDTLIIITLDTDEASKYKPLLKFCYEVNLKPHPISELVKIINRVEIGEKWKLSPEVKEAFAKHSQSDIRRLLTELEFYFDNKSKEEIENTTSQQIDEYFEAKSLRIRDNSALSLLDSIVLGTISDKPEEKMPIDKRFLVAELESYVVPIYLFETYPKIVKDKNKKDFTIVKKKRKLDQDLESSTFTMNCLAEAAESISDSDVLYGTLRENPGVFTDEMGDFTMGDVFRSLSVLIPIHRLSEVIPEKYRLDVQGYNKYYSVKAIVEANNRVRNKMNRFSAKWFEKTTEEWMFLREKIFEAFANECTWDQCIHILLENDLTFEVLEEIIKLRGTYDNAVALEGEKLYKGKMKLQFKHKFEGEKPKIGGLKSVNKDTLRKINFFPEIK